MTSPPALARPVASGRPRTAAHRLAEDNRRLLLSLLWRRFAALAADPERGADAYAVGYLALVRAAETFDPARGGTFGGYAGGCIENALSNFRKVEARAARLPTCSLEAPVGEGDAELADLIADPQAEAPGAALVSGAGFAALAGLLTGAERDVIEAVYAGGERMTEAAARLGVSRQRAACIHDTALRRLRRSPAAADLLGRRTTPRPR